MPGRFMNALSRPRMSMVGHCLAALVRLVMLLVLVPSAASTVSS